MSDKNTQAEGLDELERLAKAAEADNDNPNYWAAVRSLDAHNQAANPAAVLSLIQQARDAQHWRDRALAAEGREAALREATEDVVSHAHDWRSALTMMRDNAEIDPPEIDDRSYWQHQLVVLDRILAALTPEPDHGARTEGAE